jgi:hypothetical protein
MIIARWTDFRAIFATSSTLGPDGVEVWPLASVRASGFDGGLTGIDRPFSAFPLTVSCNAQAADGGAAYNWYLSQRTDDSSLQWMSITQYSSTQSGTVTIALTAKCVTDMGLAGVTASLDPDQLAEILKHCTLYVQRVSDDAIQLVQLLQYTLSSY